MKRNLIAFADPENNKLNPLSQTDFNRILRDFGQGTKLVIVLENYKRTRKLTQNSLIHKYFQIMSQECGQDASEIKLMMKIKYGYVEAVLDRDGEEMYDDDGEVVTKLKSTADYNTSEMYEFTEHVRDWSMKFLNCYLMDPDEWREFNLKQ